MRDPQTPTLEKAVRRKMESGLSSNANKVRALCAALKEGETSPIVKDFSFDQINAELEKDAPAR